MTPVGEVAEEPLRVLIIDPDQADAELCLLALERAGFEARCAIVASPEDFAAHLQMNVYDVVLADYRRPDWTGLDAFTLLRALGLDIPLILVTEPLGEERAVECLKQGVADWVIKENLARLPVAVRRALQEKRARSERARSGAPGLWVTSAPTGTETVLIAEDVAPLRAVVGQILKHFGYQVLEAPDGKAAMRYATDRGQSIDLLLTDVVMPDSNVRQLAEAFTGVRPGAKVLFMSGFTDDSVLRQGELQSGMAYLQKPFTPETLGRKLRELLDSR